MTKFICFIDIVDKHREIGLVLRIAILYDFITYMYCILQTLNQIETASYLYNHTLYLTRNIYVRHNSGDHRLLYHLNMSRKVRTFKALFTN